jgi:hypothetical protein
VAQGNGLLAILKHILFRFLDKHDRPFVAPRIEKYGGPQTFKTYAEVEAAFVLPEGDSGKLMAGDLKGGIRDLLNEFLHPLREKINEKVCISLISTTDSMPPAHRHHFFLGPAVRPSSPAGRTRTRRPW